MIVISKTDTCYCKNTQGVEYKALTLGKAYEVIEEGYSGYYIIDDGGFKSWVAYKLFSTIEEAREIRLKELIHT